MVTKSTASEKPKPLLVAQLRVGTNTDYFGLTLVDPYRGKQLTTFHHVEDIAEVCSRLDFAAEVRNLSFEVHDLSTKSKVILRPLNANDRWRRST